MQDLPRKNMTFDTKEIPPGVRTNCKPGANDCLCCGASHRQEGDVGWADDTCRRHPLL
jgi:hypothetical protein